MAKARKTDSATKTGTAEVPTVPVEVVSSVTSKKTTKSAGKTTPKTSEKVATKSTKVNEVAVTVEKPQVEDTETQDIAFVDTFGEFMAKLQTLTTQMNALKTEFRTLEKKAVREIKLAQKVQAKRKRKSTNRSPSGFVKPTLISNELATFLNKPVGTEMARTEVTREINGYIRAHNLQDKQNGRKINPDTQLATLLKIGSGEELTYFNLQRYMSPHFAKASSKVPPVESSVTK